MGTISYDISLFLELDIFMATAFWQAFFPNFISLFIYKTQISWVILSFLGLSSIVRLIQIKFLQALKKKKSIFATRGYPNFFGFFVSCLTEFFSFLFFSSSFFERHCRSSAQLFRCHHPSESISRRFTLFLPSEKAVKSKVATKDVWRA